MQNDKIIFRNPASRTLTGALNEKSVFTPNEKLHPDDRQMVTDAYQQLLSGEKQRITLDMRFYPVDAKDYRLDMKWVYCMANMIEFQGKDSILTYMLDFTRAKKLENLIKVQERLASLNRVAAGIAHEIRNPLSGINIYLTTLGKILQSTINHNDPMKLENLRNEYSKNFYFKSIATH